MAYAVRYAAPLLRALDVMHTQLFTVHLDVKPKNLLVCNGVVKLADIGGAINIRKLAANPPAFPKWRAERLYDHHASDVPPARFELAIS